MLQLAFDSSNLQNVLFCRTLANNAWAAFNIPQDEEVTFPTFLKMLDMINIFMVDTQAKRIFDAVDLDKSGEMGMLEFENFMMAYDVIGNETDLIILDIYDTFKVEPSDEFKEFYGNKSGMDYSGFAEACQLLEVTQSSLQKALKLQRDKKKKLAQSNNPGNSGSASGATTPNPAQAPPPQKVIKKKAKADDDDDPDKQKEEEDEENLLLQAFMYASGAKKQNVGNTFLTLDEFKRGWLKLANVEKELTKRKLKFDKIALSEGRNRERLNRYVTDQEKGYFLSLTKVCCCFIDSVLNKICFSIRLSRRWRK